MFRFACWLKPDVHFVAVRETDIRCIPPVNRRIDGQKQHYVLLFLVKFQQITSASTAGLRDLGYWM